MHDVIGGLDLISSTNVLLIDETKCIKCDNCVTACAETHGGYSRLNRRRGPSLAYVHVPVACRHCEGAPCLQRCLAGDAIGRDADGVVKIYDHCIGCGNCAADCPYEVISMVEVAAETTSDLLPKKTATTTETTSTPARRKVHRLWHSVQALGRFFPGHKHAAPPPLQEHKTLALKCDLCFNIAGGPACVYHCPTRAAMRVARADLPATVTQIMHRA